MKKTLLIAGFALCASMAFAQTAKVNPLLAGAKVRQAGNTVAEQKVRVDYKASIFAKDGETPLATCTFGSAVTTGTVAEADKINDTLVAGSAHANTTSASLWMRVPNRAAIANLDTIDYPYYNKYFVGGDSVMRAFMGPEHGVTGDDGFVTIDAADAAGNPSDLAAVINSYVELPVMSIPAGTTLLDLKLKQFCYNKRYQEFYVDYKTSANGDSWYAFELNSSVDYSPNGFIADSCYVTLPSDAVAADGNVYLRLRYYSFGRGQDHGFGWLVDDVQLFAATSVRWAFDSPRYADGFYGMIPEGFNLPIALAVMGRNTGLVDMENVQLVINHRYWEGGAWVDNEDWELVEDQPDMPAGQSSRKFVLKINERGFMDTNNATVYGMQGFYHATATRWNLENYMAEPDSMGAGWGRRGLPTDHVGKNQFILKVTATAAGAAQTFVLDTITYTVTGLTGGTHNDSLVGLTVPGYRWANDNGVIPSGSEFGYVLTNGNTFTFDPSLGHQYQSGYDLETRFVTPDQLPDTTWVFRGMEIIPATNLSAEDIQGVRIAPSASFWFQPGADYDFSLYGLNTENFFGTSIFTVDGSAAYNNNQGDQGYKLPTSRYNAVNILFPEQPSIYTNASFLFGYENKGGFFSAARTRGAYKYDVAGDSTTYYEENPELADYYRQLSPADICWTGYMYDPAVQSSLPGAYWDYYPLIRMIVGPKMSLPKAAVEIICNEEENAADEEPTSYFVYRGGVMCDTIDSVAKGITYKYEIYPGYADEDNSRGVYSHSVITSLIVDGQEIDLSDAAIAANPLISREEYNVVNTAHDGIDDQGNEDPTEVVWPPLLERYMYTVYFEDVQGNHSIEAHTTYSPLAINEVAPEVKLRLAPNPATSQVRLNIAGVNGKVNCNVIDMSGRVIYNADINAESEHVISLNGVPAGAYFVRITNDTFSKVEKLIVR